MLEHCRFERYQALGRRQRLLTWNTKPAQVQDLGTISMALVTGEWFQFNFPNAAVQAAAASGGGSSDGKLSVSISLDTCGQLTTFLATKEADDSSTHPQLVCRHHG